MKRFILCLLIMLPGLASGQRRTYIRTDSMGYDNVFFIEDVRSGEPIQYLQVQNFQERKDSLFFVLDEGDSEALSEYLSRLFDIFEEWERTAKKNKVTDYSKPIEIEAPALQMAWRTVSRSHGGWWPVSSGMFLSKRGVEMKPVFVVSPKGPARIELQLSLEDRASGQRYEAAFLMFGQNGIKDYIYRTDWKRSIRQYRKLAPKKYEKSELDEMFVQ